MTVLINQQGMTFCQPEWTVHNRVRAYVSTREGGVSVGPYHALNLASHVGDDPQDVGANRERLSSALKLPTQPVWLTQVHGTEVAAGKINSCDEADAFYSNTPSQVGVVLTADCLPVFIADSDGCEVAVVHAGWRGLLNGIIENTLNHFSHPPERLQVWLGPAIGPEKFEVGQDVLGAFLQRDGQKVRSSFHSIGQEKWLMDIYQVARLRIQACGVKMITGGEYCTVTDETLFYSYRRDGVTGRMASLIWIENI